MPESLKGHWWGSFDSNSISTKFLWKTSCSSPREALEPNDIWFKGLQNAHVRAYHKLSISLSPLCGFGYCSKLALCVGAKIKVRMTLHSLLKFTLQRCTRGLLGNGDASLRDFPSERRLKQVDVSTAQCLHYGDLKYFNSDKSGTGKKPEIRQGRCCQMMAKVDYKANDEIRKQQCRIQDSLGNHKRGKGDRNE